MSRTLNGLISHQAFATHSPSTLPTMSSWAQDCNDSITIHSASPEPPQTVSLPTSTDRRRGPSSRTASSTKQRRRKDAHFGYDPATTAAHDARLADESSKVQGEWIAYPWRARPKSRREELQRLPVLCNDFESFDKQMEHLDGTVEDPGLLSEIRAVMKERREASRREEDQARMQEHNEIHAQMTQCAQELRQGIDELARNVEQCLQGVNTYGQNLDRLAQKGEEIARDTDEYVMHKVQRRRRVHQSGHEERHNI
ncbi:hypothetical protein DENSPDRAFT_872013 [Dentipellis sp. KUC8613]|nr:hypothetical protein DENSPDRAFT_872013 [Dentipellis sp. KUC8613]